MKHLIRWVFRHPVIWLLNAAESATIWIHGKNELDPYETGKLAWEIRNLRKEIQESQ